MISTKMEMLWKKVPMHRKFNKIFLTCITVFSLFFAFPAKAESLKDFINTLEILPLTYGVNSYQLANSDIIITRALLKSETSGQGDVYTVMKQNNDEHWEIAQYKDHSFTTVTWLHTGEDAVKNVLFFVPGREGASKNFTAIYMLKSERDFENTIPSPGIATFQLYKIDVNENFSFLQFEKIASAMTKKKYTNVNDAISEELGLSYLETP